MKIHGNTRYFSDEERRQARKRNQKRYDLNHPDKKVVYKNLSAEQKESRKSSGRKNWNKNKDKQNPLRNVVRKEEREKAITTSPEKYLFTKLKYRVKHKKLEFDLDVSDIVIPEKCPILNIPLAINVGKHKINSPSVDRIDNNKGYIKGNIRVISHRANTLKSDMTIETVEKLLAYMKGGL